MKFKNYLKSPHLCVFMFLAFSCNSSSICPEYDKEYTFFATFASDSTKAQLDDNHTLYWSSEDCISVFTGPINEKYRFQGQTGDRKGTFAKTDKADKAESFTKVWAVYPYNNAYTCSKEGAIDIDIPSIQKYTVHSFDPATNIMLAVTEDISDNHLRFRNAFGWLCLKLYGLDRIREITFSGSNEEVICGSATMTAGEFNNPELELTGDGKKITLDCGEEGVELSTDKNNPTELWISLPPVTFEKGFKVDITNTYGQTLTKEIKSKVTISRNVALPTTAMKVSEAGEARFKSFAITDGIDTYEAWEINDTLVRISVPNQRDLSAFKAIFEHNGVSVKIGDVEQDSGVTVNNYNDFAKPKVYTITSATGNETKYTVEIFDLPVIIMETPNHTPITSKEIWTEGCTFIIRDTDGTLIDFGSTNLKGRGNWTWLHDAKKPFAIKFDSKPKQTVLGMPAHKRWCLLNNMAIFSNPVGFKLASIATSQDWSPRSVEVDVIYNGNHIGMYQLTEQIKIDKPNLI